MYRTEHSKLPEAVNLTQFSEPVRQNQKKSFNISTTYITSVFAVHLPEKIQRPSGKLRRILFFISRTEFRSGWTLLPMLGMFERPSRSCPFSFFFFFWAAVVFAAFVFCFIGPFWPSLSVGLELLENNFALTFYDHSCTASLSVSSFILLFSCFPLCPFSIATLSSLSIWGSLRRNTLLFPPLHHYISIYPSLSHPWITETFRNKKPASFYFISASFLFHIHAYLVSIFFHYLFSLLMYNFTYSIHLSLFLFRTNLPLKIALHTSKSDFLTFKITLKY